jgi:ribonuclease-3 family protein
MMDPKLLKGTNLSYIGDAYYELKIRLHLLDKNITKSSELRKESIHYVSALAHQQIYAVLQTELTEEENHIFLRGRNGASNHYRKNMDRGAYVISSGFEAVIGYLFLTKKQERLEYLICKSIEIIEKGETK